MNDSNEVKGKIRLRSSGTDEWETPGQWFFSLLRLGETLLQEHVSAAGLKRLLLLVPDRQMVTAAIALGMSLSRFMGGEAKEEALSVEELERLAPGTQIRVSWPLLTRDALFIALKRTGGTPKVELEMEDGKRTYSAKTVSISRLGVSVPVGEKQIVAKLSENFENPLAARWAGQVNPAGAFFTEGNHFEKQMAWQVDWEDFGTLLGTTEVSIRAASRFDYLSDDRQPHFINVFEMVSRLDDLENAEVTRLQQCRWVVLDGNDAVDRMSSNHHIAQLPTLGIVELGKTRQQDRAIRSFRTEAVHLVNRTDVASELFQLPAGCFLAAWGDSS